MNFSNIGPAFVLFLVLVILPGRLPADDLSTGQWRAVEITLTSTGTYARPFDDVDVTASFTHADGTVITRPAFWDGGNTWKIRFAPTKPGTWTYTTTCLNASDSGLQGRTGTVTCVPYRGPLAIYQHGFLRVSDDHRHLAYRDGTPFFWLADTHWLWGAERLTESNKPGWTSEFKGMADKRAAQGFTVYQVEFFDDWVGGTDQPNLANFQKNFDPKFAYLADHGFVVAATLGILSARPEDVTTEKAAREARMARYVSARYGAYPATWLTYQECTANDQNGPQWNRAGYMNIVRGVGHAFMASDAYHHPRTAHSDAPMLTAYRGEDWLDFTMLQQGHEHDMVMNRDPYYDYYFDDKATLPLVQGEANYEHLFEGNTLPGDHATVTTEDMRQAAYLAMQCGSFGYTYGANGVWQATWSAEKTGNQTTYGNTPWSVGIDLPGADQLTQLKNFYVSLGWTELIPRPECDGFLTLDGRLPAAERPALMADAAVNRVVAYFFRGTSYSGKIAHLQNAPYAAQWFNPRSGHYTEIGVCQPVDGTWTFPPKPDVSDWLLVLRAKTPVLGPTRVTSNWTLLEAARQAELAKNLALHAHATASSTDQHPGVIGVYAPENAISGDLSPDNWHHWSNDAKNDPASAAKPAWLMLEWPAPVQIRRIVYVTMFGYETQDYTIQYRDQGAWRTFGDADVTGNTDDRRDFLALNPVTTDAVRFLGKKGPAKQPNTVRVVQLEAIAP